MRLEALEALKALADPPRQREQWGKYDPQSASYEDLNMWLAALEDGGVLPDPSKAVGLTIHQTELPHISELALLLSAMISRHGRAEDIAYIKEVQWPLVVSAASQALASMESGS